MLFGIAATPAAMCVAGFATLLIGVLRAKAGLVSARGLEKILALTNACVAVPLAVFGALHLFGPQFVANIVPAYMPLRMFWVYLVGAGLIAAALSIATGIAVRWSGLLFGIMMFAFVAMIHLPGAIAAGRNRIIWTIVFRETSFGGAGWLLAGMAMGAGRGHRRNVLTVVGIVCVTMALTVFGVEHFLHPTGLPGVPLARQMAAWIPARAVIDYLTGAGLLLAAGSVLFARNTRTIAASVGAWLLLLIALIYVPVMVSGLLQPAIGGQLEGVNYFADTLLFTGAILALARAAD